MVTRNFFFLFSSLSLLALPSRRFHVFASSFAETFLSAISDLAHERDSILCCRWTGRQSSRQREPAFKIVCDVTTLYKIRILGGRRYCQLPILRFLPHFHPFLSLVLGAIIAPSLCDWSNFASPFSIIVISFYYYYYCLLDISKMNGEMERLSFVPIKAFDSATSVVKTRLSTRRKDGETHELNRAYACKSWIVWNVSSKNGLENCVSKYRIKVQRCVNRHVCKRFRASI